MPCRDRDRRVTGDSSDRRVTNSSRDRRVTSDSRYRRVTGGRGRHWTVTHTMKLKTRSWLSLRRRRRRWRRGQPRVPTLPIRRWSLAPPPRLLVRLGRRKSRDRRPSLTIEKWAAAGRGEGGKGLLGGRRGGGVRGVPASRTTAALSLFFSLSFPLSLSLFLSLCLSPPPLSLSLAARLRAERVSVEFGGRPGYRWLKGSMPPPGPTANKFIIS